MTSRLNPYISYPDTARQAMEFYRGRVRRRPDHEHVRRVSARADGPDPDKIMHAQLETPSGYTIMASDTPPGMNVTAGTNISVSLSGDDADALRGYFQKLSDGGSVTMPLEKQMWGDEFGMFTDQFGIGWMVNITQSAG